MHSTVPIVVYVLVDAFAYISTRTRTLPYQVNHMQMPRPYLDGDRRHPNPLFSFLASPCNFSDPLRPAPVKIMSFFDLDFSHL
mmetsp:Transcript_341/g.730  ORF Transcript_341/g.730 Transcript_341/m.730 type:complete len:83 (+) Transcript_341:950-1198(+)